jgi:anti-sigma factor RsiW
MKVIGFERNYCKKIQVYLDSYLNSELLVETTHEVLKHLRECLDCFEALRVRQRVKAILRAAVRREVAAEALQKRIQKSIRGHLS